MRTPGGGRATNVSEEEGIMRPSSREDVHETAIRHTYGVDPKWERLSREKRRNSNNQMLMLAMLKDFVREILHERIWEPIRGRSEGTTNGDENVGRTSRQTLFWGGEGEGIKGEIKRGAAKRREGSLPRNLKEKISTPAQRREKASEGFPWSIGFADDARDVGERRPWLQRAKAHSHKWDERRSKVC